MSILPRLRAWLGRLSAAPRTPNPDCMPLHDWADLPVHHPDCR